VGDYKHNGGAEVSGIPRKGDIIQLSKKGDPKGFYPGMHAAVVVGATGSASTFEVVDSNYDGRGVVERHYWNPYKTAHDFGLIVTIWQLGYVAGRPAALPLPQPSASAPPRDSTLYYTFHVRGTCAAGGCGLSRRSGPGITAFAKVGVVFDDQPVYIVCQVRGERVGPIPQGGASSGVWDQVYGGSWVSDLFVDTPQVDAFSPPIPSCESPAPSAAEPTGPPLGTQIETTGGVANTWTDYTNAGGTQGPTIPAVQTVEIACAVTGFRVADGNTWWYRIASSPWNAQFYVSADAFYNNGQTSGSLVGTPFVDPRIPLC
jgi:hypothetical protein